MMGGKIQAPMWQIWWRGSSDSDERDWKSKERKGVTDWMVKTGDNLSDLIRSVYGSGIEGFFDSTRACRVEKFLSQLNSSHV